MLGWLEARVDDVARMVGNHIADRIIERTGLDNISDHLGAFLLGVNGTIQEMFPTDAE